MLKRSCFFYPFIMKTSLNIKYLLPLVVTMESAAIKAFKYTNVFLVLHTSLSHKT